MIKVIIKEPHKLPEVKDIENNLKTLQNIVGGYIEVFEFKNSLCICNEEGKFQNLKPNFPINNPITGITTDIIVGTVVFVNEDEEGNFCSLTQKQTNFILNYFK